MGKRRGNKKALEKDDTKHQRQPKTTDHVTESDDEEIPEDEAFNSEDERMFGHFFQEEDKDDEDHSIDSNENDENTSDDDGSDEEGEEEDDDDDDGGLYMLNLLNNIDSEKKETEKSSKNSQMTRIPESEYSSLISKKSLTLDNLMEGLQDTKGFRDLQKTFQKLGSATPAPLEKIKADRAQRKIAYEEQVQNISGWTKIVQENRQAETLDFKPKERIEITRDTLIDKFEPKNEFEKELEKALEDAGQQDEETVLKAEEDALQDDLGANRLTMEEYKKRRGQLAQIRALMFYHEQKRHHMKKIKSKKYRRIRKKQRERLKESALEAAMQEDEDLAKELKEKEEVSRIQERMTLAHKNTSKWAKRILKRGKNVDIDTRKALSAQLKRGDDLRRKMLGDDDKSDSDTDEEDLVESARKVLEDTEAQPSTTDSKTGLFKLSFMQKGIQKQRDMARDEARKLLSELQANENDDYDKTMPGEGIEEPEAANEIASKKEMKMILNDGELIAKSLEFGNSNAIAVTGGIDIDLSSNDNEAPIALENASPAPGMTEYSSPPMKVRDDTLPHHKEALASGGQESFHNKRKEKSIKQVATAPKDADDVENPWMQDSEETKFESNAVKAIESVSKKGKSKRRMVNVDAAVGMLDAEGNDSNHTNKTTAVPLKGEVDPNEKITALSQEELVRRAFAAPSEKDAEEEFQKEKDEMAAEFDPTRKVVDAKNSKEAAGWGSWAGMGAPPPRPRKLPKKLTAPMKQKEAKRKRKDDKKPDVIINQKRLKKTANGFMLGDVPHPYTSRYEYEQAMLGGVGREWNVTGAFKNMTRKEIQTRSGKIIVPISKRSKVARAPAKF